MNRVRSLSAGVFFVLLCLGVHAETNAPVLSASDLLPDAVRMEDADWALVNLPEFGFAP